MKKINKSVLAAFILTLVGALLVGGATLALFTDTAVNTGNTFAAGTLDISLDEDAYFNISNIAPGDKGYETITVTNSGSLDMYFRLNELITNKDSVDGSLFAGSTPLEIKVEIGETELTPGGTPQFLSDGDTVNVLVSWELPIEANNDYQGLTGSLGISFSAVQADNNNDPIIFPVP